MRTPHLTLDYFDGRSARVQTAEIWMHDQNLYVRTLNEQHYPACEVRWPERQRHGERQAYLPDGGVLSCANPLAWDTWAQDVGLHDSITVRWMQSWRLVGMSLALLVALLAGSWRWGAPLVGDFAIRWIPAAVEAQIGEQSMQYVDAHWLKPSALSQAEQDNIRVRFASMVSGSYAVGQAPVYRLHFRAASTEMGPNAFALPGGDIVVTDAIVTLMTNEPDAVLGVLAHELGHVRHRHGMRMLVQASLIGAVAGVVVGDFSSVLATLPALLAQQSYARDFERAADENARQMLLKAKVSPLVMVHFFERLAQEKHPHDVLPIAFSSHPADPDRIQFFSEK